MKRHFVSGLGKKIRVVALASLAAVGACDAATAPETSRIRVLLTDAPHEELDSALVWISRVYLQGGGGLNPDTAASDSTDSSGRVDLYNDPGDPLRFDLLTLRDGVTADLTGAVEVDVGLYQSLRLVVDSARVYLTEGITFQDGSASGTLKVPSGHTSGIKVKLDAVLRAEAGDTTSVTVDFDVDQNFKIIRSGPGSAVKQVIFTPVLKEKGRFVSGP